MARFWGVCALAVMLPIANLGCSRKSGTGSGAATTVSVSETKQLFADNCAPCHGPNGKGTQAGPSLASVRSMSNPQIESIIRQGKGSMPAWEGRLNDAEIKSLVTYSKSLAK